ncbi:MAG: hypothetical protein AB1521_09190 [Bacteroidota bacterium]
MKNILITFTAILILNSCKDNGTQPPQTKSVRDYTWTADTLAYEGSAQTLMRSIWGSSANDIYICGHNDRSKGNLWHYDGTKWTAVDLFQTVESTANTLYAVHGTAPDNVWVVGSKIKNNPDPPPNFLNPSFIIQYNGSKWVEHKVNTSSAIQSVYAVSANEVWACGADGIVYSYNNGIWDIDTIKITPPTLDYQLNNIIKYKDKLYCFGRNSAEQGAKDTYYFFEKNTSGWAKVDSFIIQTGSLEFKWGPSAFYISKDNKLYSHGFGGVFEFTGSSWNNLFHTDYAITDMSGVAANNFLLSADFGHVFHYNGNDWKELEALYQYDVVYTGVWRDEDEAFIIGRDLSGYPQTTIVWHGK